MSFPCLFRPGRIGNLEVRNRIISSPMERNFCTAEGRITQRYVDYLEARARGGVGVMYTEATYVDPRGKGRELQMGLYSDDLIPDLQRLTKAVHRHGAKIGPELNFGGRVVNAEVSGLRPWAPSAVPFVGGYTTSPLALDRDGLAFLVERYAAAARRAIEAGCDFVGLHGAHGYLLSQFLSPYCNKRDDEYGGDLLNRLRFPLEVIAAVRAMIGASIPIIYRISGAEHIEGGTTIDDVCEVAPHLQAAGIDLIDVSAGMYETNWWIVQPMEVKTGILTPLARAIRARVQIPVSVAGRINDPTVAEQILEDQDADFVTMGRALHADPELPNKARAGRLDEISSCIACNQGCNDTHMRGAPVICLVNTTSGRERETRLTPAARPMHTVVVGAGPAGLECARVLALRGHRVTVLEKEEEAGGQLLLSRYLPGREEITGHITWLVAAALRAGVRIETGVEASVATIRGMHPGAVVLATGASPGLPAIPGLEKSPVVDPFQVMRRPIAGVRRALVIGGGIRGVGVARLLAKLGTQIILTECGRELITDIGQRSRRYHLLDLSERQNVSVFLETTVEFLGPDHAVLWNKQSQWQVDGIDLVVPVRPMLPVQDLGNALFADDQDDFVVYSIGDCVQPRTALDAVHEAAALAHRI